MTVIFSIEEILLAKRLNLRYYYGEYFTFQKFSRTLFAPRNADPMSILLVLVKV